MLPKQNLTELKPLQQNNKMKYALVTGGSRGIGRAVCEKLAEMGYNIIINYKSNETAAKETAELVKQHNVTSLLMKFDSLEQGRRHHGGRVTTVTTAVQTIMP